ncbi:hypothetical protein WJX73_002133 [Symbiochloris irregularis]|uniref:Amino acid transporter transmembrane domain-containing protein n=1 Tax=Symbiochloris irregularis TaxID=706552 RepID=A0AAW1P8T6_9CHLO
MCNSAIGAGVLSLPFAFGCAGIAGCISLCVVLGAFEGFTLYVLAKFAERYSAHTYSKLVRKALGRKLSATLSGVMLLYLWGSCIAYLVIIGDCFASILGLYIDGALADRRLIIAAAGLIIILPMCFPRELGALAWVSMAAVIGFVFTAIAVVIRGTELVRQRPEATRYDGVALFHFDFKALSAIPIVVFGFNSHANVVTIMTELELLPAVLIAGLPRRPSQYAELPGMWGPRPRTRKLIGMLGVILAAIALIMVGYLAVGLTGYLAFPFSVSSNVLNSFGSDDKVMLVARAIIGAVVIGHYPLNHHPARLAMEDLESFCLGWRHISPWLSYSQSILFVASTIFVAVLVKDLGLVLHMVGGTAACFMIFFLPGLLLINAAIVKSGLEQAEDDEEYDVEEEDGTPMAGEGASADALLSTHTATGRPSYLADPDERGIKRLGIIYSPRKSWWTGMFLVALSVAILIITIWTAF